LLRILQIAETYPPGYGGGAAVYIQDICRALAKRGHELRVLCVEDSGEAPYTVRTDFDGDIQVDRVNLPYFVTKDPEGWEVGLRAWRTHEHRVAELIETQVTTWRPDLVHYNASRPLGEECLAVVSRLGVPIVAMLHEAWLTCVRLQLLRSPTSESCDGPTPLRCLECIYSNYDGSRWKAALKLSWRIPKLGLYPAYRVWRRRVARRTVSAALGYSRYMTDRHAPYLNGPVKYLPLGINLQGLPIGRSKQPRTPLRFGFVAGFQVHKGIIDVLDALASMKRDGLKFELHIWGPGQESGRSELNARDLNDVVVLRGMYQPQDLWAVYDEMDVAVMATLTSEPFGRVPLEAAAMGVPTIAPAVGGIKETIRDDIDGLHYRFRDGKDLERQMRRVLTEDGLLARLRDNLLPVPDTRDQVVEIERFYNEVLGRS
jgi:glycosyltransferase involved in cell wall biosynthesis